MIYLDHHAATPLAPGVAEAMHAVRGEAWANPASPHGPGRAARRLLEGARDAIAAVLGATPADVVLTGGGTEACNLAVRGVAAGARRIVRVGAPHPAVTASVDAAVAAGAALHGIGTPDGVFPDAARLSGALDASTVVVASWVDHETGAVAPVEDWAEAVRRAGARLVVDGTQALGKRPVDVATLGAHAVAFAAHKLGGPPGAGALWVDRAVDLAPVLRGGAQERGRRPGTPDVVAHVGFAAACAAVPARLAEMPRLAALRDRLEAALVGLGGVVNGAGGARVATCSHTSHRGWRGTELVAALDLEGLAASSGAACSSGVDAPSPVVAGMYPDAPWRATSALRLGLGPETGDADVDAALEVLRRVLPRGAG